MPHIAKSSETIKTGIFSLATEAGWGSGFELKEGGEAIITPNYDHEGCDDPENDDDAKECGEKSLKVKTIKGIWKTARDGIEISYSKFKDQFKFEKECRDWRDNPCFRYEKSLASTKEKSPLNFDYPYINWDWTNPPGSHTPTEKCKNECAEMFKNGTLKKGLGAKSCIDKTCR